MILVKIGGSVLTNKAGRGKPRFHAAAMKRLAKELRGVRPLVLVHGAGSWGHPLALRHKIGGPKLSGARLRDAVSATQASVAKLRSLIVEACTGTGLPVVQVPASAVAVTRNGATRFDAAIFSFYLERGLVPVTGGDVILDDRRGARILSGDEILRILSGELKAKRVVFASDVDGVIRDGKVVRRLTASQAREIETTAARDATGGMSGKLYEAALIAESGTPVTITNGLVPGRLRAAALGGRGAGTRIECP